MAISDVIDTTLSRVRNVISYQFPRNLMILQSIQQYVFKKHGIESTADYSFYASTLENLHMDSALCALDEYGVPYQTAQRLSRYISADGNLDNVLDAVKRLNISDLPFYEFEKDILRQIQNDLQ